MSTVVDDLPFSEEKSKYILDVLDPVLEEVISDVMEHMPEEPAEFIIKWCQKRMGLVQSKGLRQSVLSENQHLNHELKKLKDELDTTTRGIETDKQDGADEGEEEDDVDDEVDDAFFEQQVRPTGPRQSVSAEAYGDWNMKKEFVPPCIAKTDDQKERLRQTLSKSFMFSSLAPKEMDVILLAMKECLFEPKWRVFNEGDEGHYLFVIEKGTLDCLKTIDGSLQVVKTVSPGDVFGELALLYNCPRAASVVSQDRSICWQLDRESFNHIVKDSAMKRRQKYKDFLTSITLLSSMQDYELSQLTDCLTSETFKQGDYVVKQNDPGNRFYIIEEGNLAAFKAAGSENEAKVMDYKPGDYFGELALLRNQPRAASVIVESETAQLLSMSRATFSKMLGPLSDLLGKASYV